MTSPAGLAFDRTPDFARFREVLLLERVCKRPPLFDFHVDRAHKTRWLGRPIETAADEVAFWRAAGYDYTQVAISAPVPELREALERAKREAGTSTTGSSHKVIPSLADYRAKRWTWQPVAEGDLTVLQGQIDYAAAIADALPEGMKVLLHIADIFTFAWEMIGFDELCMASIEQPEFISAVMDDLGTATLQIQEALMTRLGDAIGAILYSDDIAYTEGLMLSPDFFRTHLFGWVTKIAQCGQAADVPLIYHSDGRLYDVFDDLAAAGVRGIQPLEPKSMDPLEIKRRWPGKFCLLGNVDLDLMARGTADEVERHVRQRIERLNDGGGYIVGVSNTVPDYVQFDNYRRMIETVYSYPED
jgi:uroporphyrinogen decarboxylase